MRILSVLHPGGGHSGLLRDAAAAAGDELVEWTPGEGEELPGALSDFDGIAVFGGGMNVPDQERLPWLTGEIELLRDALAAGLPVLGVCLGAQLLVAAAGGEVHRVDAPEIGWLEVERLPAGDADPVAGSLPDRFTAFQWHSYACRLPAGAVELARSPVCPQAFVLGGSAWGVQFHPEVDAPTLDGWLRLPEARRKGFEDGPMESWIRLGRGLADRFLALAAQVPPRSRRAATRAS
jgi:GMP synthase (glutamine-hydrolysing)